jgi:hypothetical protein
MLDMYDNIGGQDRFRLITVLRLKFFVCRQRPLTIIPVRAFVCPQYVGSDDMPSSLGKEPLMEL